MSDQQQHANATQQAGWYADPWGSAETRWWDGAEWSSLIASPGRGGRQAAPHHDVPTNTVWIWLLVLVPLVSTTLFLADDPAAAFAAIFSTTDPSYGVPALQFSPAQVFNLVLPIFTVVFAYVDWRTLRSRGIDRPFAWGWSFFAFLITSGVYVIGRGVVLRRQTARGLGPVWVWIAVTVVTIAVPLTYMAIAIAAFLGSPEAGLPA